jgi:hypothetical protein
VDLGTRESKGTDLTVLFTIVVHPNEDREILNITSGRWQGPDIVKQIFDVQARYHSIVIVESNAAQVFIQQFIASKSAIPVKNFNTGKNKLSPEFGIESLAVELYSGKWIIPNADGVVHPEITAWISEMLYYSPSAHTGDRLMASWFAREGSRQKRVVVGTKKL